MKQENNDNLDKILFDAYEKNKNIPLSTQNTINNTIDNIFSEKNAKHKKSFNFILKRVAILVISLSVVTASTVFAKDIINFFTSIFTNSNEGVDTAVENGYVQNVDMDFIEDNNLGVKVDYVLMDDHNLNISFVYKYLGDNVEQITSLYYMDITIKDEKENLLYRSSRNNQNDTMISLSAKFTSNQQILDNTTIRTSLFLTSNSFPKSEMLYISINNVSLKNENEIININGNWNFSINLEDKFVYRTSYEYNCSDNKYVNNVETLLTDTSLSITLELNTAFEKSIIYLYNSIILKDSNNNNYNYTKMSSKNISESSSTITIFYPITIYDTNIDKLYLHVNLDSNKSIDIELLKE
mgnify:CR=1 FL=1